MVTFDPAAGLGYDAAGLAAACPEATARCLERMDARRAAHLATRLDDIAGFLRASEARLNHVHGLLPPALALELDAACADPETAPERIEDLARRMREAA